MVRLAAAGAALIAVTYGLARFALGLFVPEFRAAFDLSATGIGWVMAASFGGYLVALAGAGRLVARWGARAVAVGSGAAAAIGVLGVAAAPGPVVLAAAAAVGGASTGLASPSLATAVERQLAAAERSATQTIVNAGTSLGLIVAVPAALLAAATWRAAWAAFLVPVLAATFAASRAVASHDARIGRLRATGRLGWPLATTAVLLGLASAVFWGFGRELLETGSGLSPAVSRTAWVAVGLGGLAGAAAGGLADRRGLRFALIASWATFVVAHAALAFGPAHVLAALASAAAFGAAYMALTGLLIVWSVAVRPGDPGSAVAAVFLLLAAGQIVGSPLAGSLADGFGLPAAFGAAAVLGALAVLPAGEAAARTTSTPLPGAADACG